MLPVETLKIGSEEATVVATTAETGGDLFALEGFSRAAAALAASGSPAIDEILAVAEEHGIEMLGPVPRVVSS